MGTEKREVLGFEAAVEEIAKNAGKDGSLWDATCLMEEFFTHLDGVVRYVVFEKVDEFVPCHELGCSLLDEDGIVSSFAIL